MGQPVASCPPHLRGIGHCLGAKIGKILWEERLRGQHTSQASAEGHVYFFNAFGTLRTVKPGKSFQAIAESELSEKVFGSLSW